jgi:hypothetical protein
LVLQVNKDLEQDFRELRHTLQQQGLFKANPVFHLLQLVQFLVLEMLAYQLVCHCGASLWAFVCTTLLLTTSQVFAYKECLVFFQIMLISLTMNSKQLFTVFSNYIRFVHQYY